MRERTKAPTDSPKREDINLIIREAVRLVESGRLRQKNMAKSDVLSPELREGIVEDLRELKMLNMRRTLGVGSIKNSTKRHIAQLRKEGVDAKHIEIRERVLDEVAVTLEKTEDAERDLDGRANSI